MDELFKKIKITPKNEKLYLTAFSHSSYANEHKAEQDYERLEFLGDEVLDLVVADYLYSNKKENEGEMTKVRASYVCENALYEYSMSLGLNQYIKVGHGKEKERISRRKDGDAADAAGTARGFWLHQLPQGGDGADRRRGVGRAHRGREADNAAESDAGGAGYLRRLSAGAGERAGTGAEHARRDHRRRERRG